MSGKNYHILIVDDDAEFHQHIRYAFRRQYVFDGAVNADQLFRKLKERQDYDLVLLDMVFDDPSRKTGLELIPRLMAQYARLPIIVVTADRGIDTVVQAMKLGARDFLVKDDFDFDFWNNKFISVIEDSQLKAETTQLRVENQKLREEVSRRRSEDGDAYAFIGESGRIAEIKRILRLVSEEPNITVLLTGETGTGKEVAARYLHANSPRKDKPFQAVNLSAIQDTLLESTLFGHKKGAFTGAARDVEGYFNQANGGILMLDEIGDIDHSIQVKLLRFLETKLIRPVGSDKDVQLDVQVVAATHRNLDEAVKTGRFRADLYQRLKAMVVELPPLRERPEDISLLLEHYLNTPDLQGQISEEALRLLFGYEWVGNIRELKNAVSYMLLRKKIFGLEIITPECLPAEIQHPSHPALSATTAMGNMAPSAGGVSTGPALGALAPASIDEEHALIDLERIEALLIQKNKVKRDVAVEMGLENTDNLRYRIKKHYERHPHLFNRFPNIRQTYRKIVVE